MNYTSDGFPIWDDALEQAYYTPEELAESDLRVALIKALMETRHAQSLSQRDLEALSGVKQPQIARMERGDSDPRLSTIIKLLSAMGKTLAIVPLETSV